MSAIIDYSDRATCIIFGDGGGAVLLEPDTNGYGIYDAVLKAMAADDIFCIRRLVAVLNRQRMQQLMQKNILSIRKANRI